ncbi:MAG: hypothetical protein EZS28_053666, partial [Streblomastix strix]
MEKDQQKDEEQEQEEEKELNEEEKERESLIQNIIDARRVFEEAERSIPTEEPEQRKVLYDSWVDFEEQYGTSETAAKIDAKRPSRHLRLRPIVAEDGSIEGQEEYIEYVFPEDQKR